MSNDWFEELALAPDAHPVAMGTRSLGDRPWLVRDEDHARDVEIKRELLRDRREAVLFTTPESTAAAERLAELVVAESAAPAGMHPIEHAALAVQEDLCLMRRIDGGWHLDASCLCFPTRWQLRQKTGLHIAAVHGPVDGYDPRITTRVDKLFDALTARPVWRRNWFLMTDPTLHQPTRPPTETIISRDRVAEDLFIRSERQTLRRLDDDWSVFTIRIQHQRLGQLLTDADRVATFRAWVSGVSDDFGARRHLTESQRIELIAALDNWSS